MSDPDWEVLENNHDNEDSSGNRIAYSMVKTIIIIYLAKYITF
jgi:hypothetical protein